MSFYGARWPASAPPRRWCEAVSLVGPLRSGIVLGADPLVLSALMVCRSRIRTCWKNDVGRGSGSNVGNPQESASSRIKPPRTAPARLGGRPARHPPLRCARRPCQGARSWTVRSAVTGVSIVLTPLLRLIAPDRPSRPRLAAGEQLDLRQVRVELLDHLGEDRRLGRVLADGSLDELSNCVPGAGAGCRPWRRPAGCSCLLRNQ